MLTFPMTQSIKSLADAARAMPPEDQAELIDELIVGLSLTDGGWTAAWSREADRRWVEHTASGHDGHDADDVIADISKHLKKRRQRA